MQARSSGLLGSILLSTACGLLASACGASGHEEDVSLTPTAGAGGGSGADAGGIAPLPPRPEKVDLVLMVDNSITMGEKQPFFADAVRVLLRRLRQPDCVDAQGGRGALPSIAGVCPSGFGPEFQAITDINVAVISSSLGDAGDSDVCARPEQRDMAHVIGSTERGAVASMNSQGFLEWRDVTDEAAFERDLAASITAAGHTGCGYEASLEAWYRFLIEPEPYESLQRVACSPGATTTDCIAPATDAEGRTLIDQTLLAQRSAFLRPDSLLMILSLSDENDCSVRVGGSSWLMSSYSQPMPSAASICASNPNAQCCYSCGAAPPSGCSADPICDAPPTQLRDDMNLRCWEQKRRFGVDFLYPTERYVHALTEPRLCPSQASLAVAGCKGETIANPLFSGGRPAAHIGFASVVGVPWQDLTVPDSAAPASVRRVADLNTADWDRVLGRPEASPPVPPSDPFMVESATPRPGIEQGNPINGFEYDTSRSYDPTRLADLQFACIFPLRQPIDCGLVDPNEEVCECHPEFDDSPLCAQSPGASPQGALQYFSRAFPGVRHLEVLRRYSEQGGNATLGSICPRDVTNDTQSSYGYRPAMQTMLEQLTPVLRAPARQ